MYSCQEVSGGFVIACCDGAVEFELGEEVFDEMTGFVEFFVVATLLLSIAFGWNDRGLSCLGQRLQHSLVRIEALVGQQCIRLQSRQQHIGTLQIAGLAAGEMKSDRVAKGVDRRVNLGAQTSLAAPDGLFAAPFLRAPALC